MTETAEKKSADACTEALRTYGAELLGYLEAIHPPDDAQEVFARACERIWKGMDGFRGESSLRTWLYVVVSNESKRYLSRPEARRRSETMGSLAAPGTRTATPAYRRTGPKEALRAFRDGLPPEERMLGGGRLKVAKRAGGDCPSTLQLRGTLQHRHMALRNRCDLFQHRQRSRTVLHFCSAGHRSDTRLLCDLM